MRRIISAMRITADGYIQDTEGKIDWVESWEDEYDLLDQVDLAVLGSGMYSGYEQYWTAALNPKGKLPFSGNEPTPKEVVYANWAARTPHIVVSRKPLNVNWKNTRVVSDLEEIRELKQKTGKDIYAIGGAILVSALINHGLVDELRLIVHPVLLGGGKALFNSLAERKHLKLESAEQRDNGEVYLIYSMQSK